MKRVSFVKATIAAFVTLTLGVGNANTQSATGKAQPADSVAKQAAAGEYLTAAELHALFYGRTWRWGNDGGGYYRGKGREFLAFSDRGDKHSYAQGKWFITNRGRICTRATWTSLTWKGTARECLEHKKDGRRIFQRKLPGGDWYVFKHIPTGTGDVYNQLVPGDLVSAAFERNKKLVDAQRRK